MILTGEAISKEVSNGGIVIQPFHSDSVTTNSYDLTLGDTLLRYTGDILDPRCHNEYEEIKIPEDGIELEKGAFVLGSSREVIGSDLYVPMIHARSGIARLGLFVHVTADLIDIGSKGNATFQLHATLPIKIYPGMKIGQVTFWQPKGEIRLYQGKYQASQGPVASKSFLDS